MQRTPREGGRRNVGENTAQQLVYNTMFPSVYSARPIPRKAEPVGPLESELNNIRRREEPSRKKLRALADKNKLTSWPLSETILAGTVPLREPHLRCCPVVDQQLLRTFHHGPPTRPSPPPLPTLGFWVVHLMGIDGREVRAGTRHR